MAAFRLPRAGLFAGIPLVCLGVLLSALAGADPYRPHDPPQLWPDGGRPSTGWAPDPQPLQAARQWVLSFRYQGGKVQLVGARALQLPHPVTTPRRMGRYAVELLSGPDLVDRVRFDFPMLAADELAGQPRRPYNDPPRFEVRAVVTYPVTVPDSPRISRARLVDRATGATMMIAWPPVTEASDAGVDARVDGAQDARADGAQDAGGGDGAVSDASVDARAIPDAFPVPDAWHPPLPRDGAPGPIPRDATPFEASR